MTGRALVLALFVAGCGDVMPVYYKSVSTTAIAAASCRDMLSEAHEQKTDDVKAKARAGHPDEAQADLNRWTATYDKVKKVCLGLKLGARAGLDAAPIVEAAATRQKEAAGWIARLAKLLADAVPIMAEAGLKLPGVN